MYVYKLKIEAGFAKEQVLFYWSKDNLVAAIKDYMDTRLDTESDAPYFRVERIRMEDG